MATLWCPGVPYNAYPQSNYEIGEDNISGTIVYYFKNRPSWAEVKINIDWSGIPEGSTGITGVLSATVAGKDGDLVINAESWDFNSGSSPGWDLNSHGESTTYSIWYKCNAQAYALKDGRVKP